VRNLSVKIHLASLRTTMAVAFVKLIFSGSVANESSVSRNDFLSTYYPVAISKLLQRTVTSEIGFSPKINVFKLNSRF
jgi:hypothetical protein